MFKTLTSRRTTSNTPRHAAGRASFERLETRTLMSGDVSGDMVVDPAAPVATPAVLVETVVTTPVRRTPTRPAIVQDTLSDPQLTDSSVDATVITRRTPTRPVIVVAPPA